MTASWSISRHGKRSRRNSPNKSTYLMEQTSPAGLAVRISAVHMCKTHRGVRASHSSRMVTSEYFGTLFERPDVRAEFLQECALLERSAI